MKIGFLMPVVLAFLNVVQLNSQFVSKIDSLKKLLEKEVNDTSRVILNYSLSYELQFSDLAQASEYAEKALIEAKTIRFKKGIGRSLIQIGNIEQLKGNFESARDYNTKALEILGKSTDRAGIAICYNNLGILEHNSGNYENALRLYSLSLQINDEIGRKKGSATSLLCIGTVYENLSKYDSALTYYLEAQKICEVINDLRLQGVASSSVANVYFAMGNFPSSFEYYEKAVDFFLRSGNILGLQKTYRSLGIVEENLGQEKRAAWYYREALRIAIQLDSRDDIASNLFSIGQIFENSGQNDSAYFYYEKAEAIYSSTGNSQNQALTLLALARIDNLELKPVHGIKKLNTALKLANLSGLSTVVADVYKELAMCYFTTNEYRKAFQYLNRSYDIRDSVLTLERQKQVLELQTKYETEKKEQENLLLKKDHELLTTTRNSLIIGAVLLVLIALVIYNSLTAKKRDNRLLREQKEEIRQQKEIVEVQKASITDSIRYARRIQSAMLPPVELIGNNIPENFILYLPRDIVSGDFFWFRELSEDMFIICAADCTGHGVPGAFMSMLGMSLLNEIVNTSLEKIRNLEYSTGDILNELRARLKTSLRQTGREGEARDGMDLSLCLFSRKNRILRYSGANNPVYIVSSGELTELKATRNPIGIYLNEIPFSVQVHQLDDNSVVYMFSDGFSDQIGQGGKKFLSKNFKKLLSEISDHPVNTIKEKIHKAHLDWRGNEEQVDDILVIGVKI